MKLGRIMIIMAICLATGSMATAPAFAWDWPIFGFGPGPGAPLTNGPLPSTILPGTIEWAYQPGSSAQMVLPGYTYGRSAFQGNVAVGPMPLYGGTIIGLPGFSGINPQGTMRGINFM